MARRHAPNNRSPRRRPEPEAPRTKHNDSNTMKRSEIEIMAPVGSYESLMAAIHAGANSVYFGVGKLNMRSASAANFTLDDLGRIVKRPTSTA